MQISREQKFQVKKKKKAKSLRQVYTYCAERQQEGQGDWSEVKLGREEEGMSESESDDQSLFGL